MTYKIAIVTGASSGIGAAIASKLASDGTKVFAISRSRKALNKIQSKLSVRAQKRFIPIVSDVSDRTKIEKSLKSIYAKTGDIDLVVSNAGVGYSKTIAEHNWEEIDQIVATNLGGTINMVKMCLGLQKRRPIQIVATSSLAGKIGFPNMPIYTATKFAIEGLFESLRYEYSKEQVSFTILRPGITSTAFFSKAGMEDFQDSVKTLKSYYSPEQVAETFLEKLRPDSHVVVVGNDKYFLKLLPFIPFSSRLKILDIVNKL